MKHCGNTRLMHHIHLDECNSTQDFLKNFLQDRNFKEVLISCDFQSAGVGRQGNRWVQGKNSLAFSFTLNPGEVVSLTSLEIAVLISNFFNSEFLQKIKLKWPNDLMVDGKKCGGILCQNWNSYLLIGVGINIGEISVPNASYEVSSLDILANKKEIPEQIYSFILKNRLSPSTIKQQWMDLCIHQGKKVRVENENGKFLNIGEMGELILKTETGIKKIYSGSLFLI